MPMVADDDAQAAQADVAAMETVDDNPARELFEALLSNPALGAAEALALLGTCKAARSVGGAPSLAALRAVSLDEDCLDERMAGGGLVPHVRSLQAEDPIPGRDLNGKLYSERSAVVVASGAAARLTPAGFGRHLSS